MVCCSVRVVMGFLRRSNEIGLKGFEFKQQAARAR
jgi:hypothetical protein